MSAVPSDKLSTRVAEADPWQTPLREPTTEEIDGARRTVAALAKDTADARYLLAALGLT